MLKRIVRDAGILAIFCAVFWGFISAVNLLGEDGSQFSRSELSEARRMSDGNLARKDYAAAVRSLTEQTEADQFNSHAWFKLGQCYWQMWKTARQPYLEVGSTPPNEKELEKQIELANKALAALEYAREYPRYRVSSLFMSAALNTQHEKHEEALTQLEATLEFEDEVRDSRFMGSAYFDLIKYEPRFLAVQKVFKKRRTVDRDYRNEFRNAVSEARRKARDQRARRKAGLPVAGDEEENEVEEEEGEEDEGEEEDEE